VPEPRAEATTLRATHRARLDQELEDTVPLRQSETVLVAGVVRSGAFRRLARLSYLRVTGDRVALLRHFATRPDAVTEIPAASLSTVQRTAKAVRLEFASRNGSETLTLHPWRKGWLSGLEIVEPKVSLSADELLAVLASLRHEAG
jgi:hypothetical protein